MYPIIKKFADLKHTFIIAEAGSNWKCGTYEEDLEQAKKLIKIASESGADAVKFQTYKAEKITSVNSPSYWNRKYEKTSNQYELFKKYDKFGYNIMETVWFFDDKQLFMEHQKALKSRKMQKEKENEIENEMDKKLEIDISRVVSL